MKKSSKIALISTLTAVVGVIVFIIGMSIIGWDFKRHDVAEYTAKSYAAGQTEHVERIELNIKTFPIVVTLGDVTSLDYYETNDSDTSVTYENGTLKIVEKYMYNPFKSGMFNMSRSGHRFVLTVSDGSDLVINGSNCNISASNIVFSDIDIRVTNLDIMLKDCTADSFKANSTNLDAKLMGCEMNSLTVDATNAEVSMNGCEIGSVIVDSTNSDVDILGGTYSELSVESTNNDIDIERASVQTIVLRGTNGDYVLENVTVDYLTAEATNLDADLEIAGEKAEYTIKTRGNGLPREQTGTTDKLINLSGLNCEVELKFITAVGGVRPN